MVVEGKQQRTEKKKKKKGSWKFPALSIIRLFHGLDPFDDRMTELLDITEPSVQLSSLTSTDIIAIAKTAKDQRNGVYQITD